MTFVYIRSQTTGIRVSGGGCEKESPFAMFPTNSSVPNPWLLDRWLLEGRQVGEGMWWKAEERVPGVVKVPLSLILSSLFHFE